MNINKSLQRINELAKKKKAGIHLTEEELAAINSKIKDIRGNVKQM